MSRRRRSRTPQRRSLAGATGAVFLADCTGRERERTSKLRGGRIRTFLASGEPGRTPLHDAVVRGRLSERIRDFGALR